MAQRMGLAAGGLSSEDIVKRVMDKFPSGLKVTGTAPHRVFVTADRGVLFSLCEFLKGDLDFEHVSCVCGVDWPEQGKMQTVYHITSYANTNTMEILVDLPRDAPEVDSITPLWGGANWHERETYDCYGIIFKNHPKLERILNPEGTDYFPFRKDVVAGRRV